MRRNDEYTFAGNVLKAATFFYISLCLFSALCMQTSIANNKICERENERERRKERQANTLYK